MSPWPGIALFFAGLIVSIAIRAPHERRSQAVRVAESRRGPLEALLLFLMFVGHLLLPVLYAATSLLAFADYSLHPVALGAGTAFLLSYLWLFHRSHADLGTNWSVSLEVREGHALVTTGVYARVRHPMYAAIFLVAFAQLLLLPNWVAGPACLVAFTLMFLLRFRREERMMVERFGAEYEAYAARTRRLIPGVW